MNQNPDGLSDYNFCHAVCKMASQIKVRIERQPQFHPQVFGFTWHLPNGATVKGDTPTAAKDALVLACRALYARGVRATQAHETHIFRAAKWAKI